ncbi:PAS domain-containing protein [Halorubrum tibetense]|uniref:histidine kinase n=1 Tax=Halorubrum tibetense TaxID=175631 RepID=A0ABD5S9H3_9EURY
MTLRPRDQTRPTNDAPPTDSDRFLATVAVDGEVTFAGPSVPGVLGVDRGTFTGSDFLEYVHPNGRTAVSDALSAVATDRRVTHRLRHASGGYVWVESVVDEALAPAFEGRVVTSRRVDVDGAFPDRFREFLEYGTDIVTVVDADGRVRYESPSVEDVLGYEQGSLVGQSPLGYVHPEDRERVTEGFYRALSDPDTAAASFEYRYRTADGDWVWLESRTRSLPDDAVGELVINSRDVSERKRRERRLADRNERLDRFASIVSHDLRNPLSVIRASIEMAKHKDDLDPLDRGERAVDRIDQLTTELLTLARQGDGLVEPTEFSLEAVVHDAWEVAGTADADLLVGDDATIRGDRSRIQQVFENLFRNSVEHGSTSNRTQSGDSVEHGSTSSRAEPDDSVEHGFTSETSRTAGSMADSAAPTIAVTATDGGFIVADDGPGIDPENRSDVFESGFTTSDHGTGYGLDIVREIVESHGWRVRLADPMPEAADDGPRIDPPADRPVHGRALAVGGACDDFRPSGACFVVHAPTPSEIDRSEPWIAR